MCYDLKTRGINTANDHLFQHNHWTGKDCPYDIRRNNPYDWNTFVSKVQERLTGSNSSNQADQILTVGSKVKFNGIFKINQIIKPNSKYKNGAVGSYATCYGYPVGINDFIPCGPLAICNSDGSNVNYNGIAKIGGYWKSDKIFTIKGIELPTKYTRNGVAVLEADGLEFRVDSGVLYEVSNN